MYLNNGKAYVGKPNVRGVMAPVILEITFRSPLASSEPLVTSFAYNPLSFRHGAMCIPRLAICLDSGTICDAKDKH